MISLKRSHVTVRTLCALLLGLNGLPIAAQSQPSNTCTTAFKGQRINLVVPHKPGGGFDAYARLLAPALEQALLARVSVSNMPAASGLAGLQALLRPSRPDVHWLGVSSLTPLFEREFMAGDKHFKAADFALLGVFSHGNTVWITRRGEDLMSKRGPVVIAGSVRTVSGMHLPAMALGLEVKTIASLTSSGESMLALLRGDIDIMLAPEQLFERGLVDATKVQPWVFFSPPLDTAMQGGLVLAGPGGLVDQLAAGLPAEQQRRRQAAAALAEAFGRTAYVVLVADATPAATQACLRQVVERISFDSGFIAQAERQRLDPRPMRVAQAQALGRSLEQLVQDHREVIDEAIQRSR